MRQISQIWSFLVTNELISSMSTVLEITSGQNVPILYFNLYCKSRFFWRNLHYTAGKKFTLPLGVTGWTYPWGCWGWGAPCAENDKKNVHEEPYFRSLSVSNNWPSHARSEAHKVILNPPNHHKSESVDTKISIQSVTSTQRSRITAKDEWWFSL